MPYFNVWAENSDVASITLSQAVESAIKNDKSLKLFDDKIDLAKRRYNYALSMAKDAPDKYWGNDAQHIANKKEEILYPLQRKATLDSLVWERQNSENNLRIEVTRQYFQILQKEQTLANQENIISLNNKEYETRKNQMDLGNITESTLLQYEMAVNNAEITLQSLQNELDNMFITFNDTTGVSLDTKVSLQNIDLPAVNMKIDSVDKLAESVVASSHDVQKMVSDQQLKKTENEILHQYSMFKLPDECESLENDILNLDYDILNKKADIELKVHTDYNNLLNLGDDISIKKLDYDYKTKLYDIAKKKYDLGMITYLDCIKAEGEKDNALIDYKLAQLTYYIAYEQFKLYISPATIE